MHVLFFGGFARTPHIEADLELMQRHLDAGDDVTILRCHGEMVACTNNLRGYASVCSQCRGRYADALSRLTKRERFRERPFLQLTADDRAALRALPKVFASSDELRALRLGEFDLGTAALSSLIAEVRDPEPDLAHHADLVRRLLVTAAAVYRSVQNQLRERPAQLAYVFNGRVAESRAFMRACQHAGIRCAVHERGWRPDVFSVFPDDLPHNYEYLGRLIAQWWDDAADTDPQRERIGAEYYEQRFAGKSSGGVHYIGRQQDGVLPDGFDASRHNVVIYNSSEYEYAAIADAQRISMYPTQQDAITRISADLARLHEGAHLWVRVHPHLVGDDNRQTRFMRTFTAPRTTVIPAESPVCSYTLMKACQRVVSFGSTTGIEAVYHGVPSILAAPANYGSLGGNAQPQSHDELIQMLVGPLEPGPREAALKYGYFFKTFGDAWQHFAPRGYFKGSYDGRPIAESRASRVRTRVYKMLPGVVKRAMRARRLARLLRG
ncbi:MAG: hypothetical protein AB7K09_14380 [Planctomycetota bacterium]